MNNGMILLEENKYEGLLMKLHLIPFNTLFARAVLEKKVTGVVYVDNTVTPNTVLISHYYGMSLLFGETNHNEFNKSLVNYMLNAENTRFKNEFMQVYPNEWNRKLTELLGAQIIDYETMLQHHPNDVVDELIKQKISHIIQWKRVNLIHKDIDRQILINNGSKTNNILFEPFKNDDKKKFYENAKYETKKEDYKNLLNVSENHRVSSFLISLIDSKLFDLIDGSVIPMYFWKSKEAFLANGVGFALIINNEIASIAFSAFRDDNVLEIGVETFVTHRRLGYAKIVCNALIQYCKTKNYIPIWACKKENNGSLSLAKSLGFEETIIIPYYELINTKHLN